MQRHADTQTTLPRIWLLAVLVFKIRPAATALTTRVRVISNSPGELQPVFQAMLANATRLCEAKFGLLNLRDGEVFRCVAVYKVPRQLHAVRLNEGSVPTRNPVSLVSFGLGRLCISTT